MTPELQTFLTDFAKVLQDRLDESSRSCREDENPDSTFDRGRHMAYYDILDILHQQIVGFGYDPAEVHLQSPSLTRLPRRQTDL